MLVYLSAALFAGGFAFALSRSVALAVANAVFGFLWFYLALPVVAADHASFWFAVVMLTVPVTALHLGLFGGGADEGAVKRGAGALVGICGGILALLVVAFFTSSAMTRAKDYAALIGEVEQVDQQALTERMETFDQTQARFVDQGLAMNRAEELLGVQSGLASKVGISTPSIQSVDGRLVWVGGLEHAGWIGFSKWSANGSTPGYYRVDQTNRRDAEMVLEHDMRCIPSAFFGEDLDRAIYEAGYWNVGFTDETLEVDDSGDPHWVVTLYEHKVGFMGSDATGVLVVDPATCEIEEHGVEEAPAWIDRVHPADFLETQLSDWGVWRHGWWNGFWSESEPTMDTTAGEQGEAGLYFVRTKDGDPAWYTGMQSTKSDRGTQGYVTLDARTKAATYHSFAGVTEQAVQEALLGVVAEKQGYTATYPIPYNVQGHLTHVAVLKDSTGNPQLYGFASASNRDWKVVGDTPREAMRKFAAELRSSGYDDAMEGAGERESVTGPVARIGHSVVDGSSVYLFTLENVGSRAFRVPVSLNDEVALTRVGDPVELTLEDNKGAVLNVWRFDNRAIEFDESAEQVAVDEAREKVRSERRAETVDKRFERLRDGLSTEEKRQLIEKLGRE